MDAQLSVLSVLSALYDAAVRPERFDSALDAVAEHLDGYAAGVAMGRLGVGMPPRLFASEGLRLLRSSFERGVAVPDPLVEYMDASGSPIAELVSSDVVLPRHEAENGKSAYYNEVMRTGGHEWGPNYAAVLAREDGRLTSSVAFTRPLGIAPLGERALAFARLLTPHLVTAREIWARLHRHESMRAGLAAAIDSLPMGVLLLDRQLRVSWANRRAEQMIRSGDGLSLERGCPRAADPGVDRAMRTLIEGLVREEQVGAGGSLRVERSLGRAALEVLIAPVPAGTSIERLRSDAAVAMFVTDPDADLPRAHEVLRSLYSLTPAECALALELASDVSLAEAADRLGVTVGTARQRLKMIFGKTGTGRQSSLVRLINRGPAALLPLDGPDA